MFGKISDAHEPVTLVGGAVAAGMFEQAEVEMGSSSVLPAGNAAFSLSMGIVYTHPMVIVCWFQFIEKPVLVTWSLTLLWVRFIEKTENALGGTGWVALDPTGVALAQEVAPR